MLSEFKRNHDKTMARKPTGKPVGRPEKPIDWPQFEQLCALQCTQSEIGSMFGICENTLSDRAKAQYGDDYSTIYKRFSEKGKCSFRRNQFVLSKKNASVAIWLGKIWLGQRDPGIDETKEDALHAIKQAIREIHESGRTEPSDEPQMANRQFVLDKRLGRQQG